MSKVMNVAGHPIDLDDGRSLAPGEEAEGVDTDHPHNKVSLSQGALIVVESRKKPAGDGDDRKDKN